MSEESIDILTIDNAIKEKFKENINNLENYEQRLIQIKESLNEPNLNSRLQKHLENSLISLETDIVNIKENKMYNFYLIESISILDQYQKILNEPEVSSFMGRPAKFNQRKNKCVDDFLEIAKKYINIESVSSKKISNKSKNIVCKNCKNKKDFDITDNNIYICMRCFAQQTIIKHISTYNDIDRINISSKYMYDRKVHFRDCIKQYQGKQNSTIPQKVYKELEHELQSHHILLESESEIDSEKFKNVTKNHILLFLKELGYSNHYENVHLIHKTLTGQKADDISYLEDQLMDDFDSLTELYDKNYKDINRKNFINTQYVLYQLLRRHKHPCKKEEFIILKTIDRKFFHDDICKNLFQTLGWNHSPFY